MTNQVPASLELHQKISYFLYVDLVRPHVFFNNVLKRRTDAESECTEDRRDRRVGATEYAEGNGTQKRGGDAERIT